MIDHLSESDNEKISPTDVNIVEDTENRKATGGDDITDDTKGSDNNDGATGSDNDEDATGTDNTDGATGSDNTDDATRSDSTDDATGTDNGKDKNTSKTSTMCGEVKNRRELIRCKLVACFTDSQYCY